jgi:tetratricopeptide (TPR) repeat protein
MHPLRSTQKFVLTAAIAAAAATPLACAQEYTNDQTVQQTDKHELVQKRPVKVVQMYPDATRKDPGIQASPEMVKNILQMHKLVDAKSNDEAIALGEKMLADPKANHFDRAAAYQGIGYANFSKQDFAKAAENLQSCVAENGLPNNDQYQTMLNLAKAQIASGQADAGLATLARLVTETKLDKPEYNGIRGRASFMKKDYASAAQALQKSVDAATKPDLSEQQMLFASYYELKQPDRAEKIAQAIVAANPDDKAAILNLAAAYQEAGQSDKAAEQLDGARKRGLLTDAKDYRQLYVLYSNIKGRENDSISVINDGLQKGILQPNAEVYTSLAEDYFFTNRFPQAIDAYRKADAVSTDGEAALNLAKVYNNQGQAAEAKAAAERALQKGVKNPADARGIIERAGGTTKKPAKKK